VDFRADCAPGKAQGIAVEGKHPDFDLFDGEADEEAVGVFGLPRVATPGLSKSPSRSTRTRKRSIIRNVSAISERTDVFNAWLTPRSRGFERTSILAGRPRSEKIRATMGLSMY